MTAGTTRRARPVSPPPLEVESLLVNVTPEMALAWLEQSRTAEREQGRANRKVQDIRVTTYALDMLAGDWRVTGESIKFDRTGYLIDGQHRLQAIIEAQVPVPMFVTTGLEPEAQDVLDTGRKRTMGDVLAIRGHGDSNLLAGVATLEYMWTNGNRFDGGSRNTVSHSNVAKVVAEHGDAIESAISFARARSVPGLSTGVRSFVLFKLRQIDEEAANQFMADLSSLKTEGDGDPKAALLRRLATAQAARERIDRYTQVKIVFRVWNMVRRGEYVKKIQVWSNTGTVQTEDPI